MGLETAALIGSLVLGAGTAAYQIDQTEKAKSDAKKQKKEMEQKQKETEAEAAKIQKQEQMTAENSQRTSATRRAAEKLRNEKGGRAGTIVTQGLGGANADGANARTKTLLGQ